MESINITSPSDLKHKIVLVIEDNKEIQDSLKMALETEDYTVFTADNGKEGLELLTKIPTPCLILLDLLMPVMNGWEFIEAISTDLMFSMIPVVVVSALADKKDAIKIDGYIQKPIELNSLLEILRKHCS